MLTANEIFDLRRQGKTEEAYLAARELYAHDKSQYASSAMFWTAVDILKKRVNEGRKDEATKICMALENLFVTTTDEKGWKKDAMNRCQKLVGRSETRERILKSGPMHLQSGVWGEELAAAYLREKGYVILERDWHSSHRDIDIIAQQGDTIVFVEVKTRRSSDFGEPETAVTYKKQQNICRAINHYINYKHVNSTWRFDVIAITGMPGCANPIINHIEDFRLYYRRK